jgi:fatty acid desaturase
MEDDGKNELARDSRAGLATNFVVGVVVSAAIGGLTSIDTTTWSGWWVPFVTLGISTALGAATAYKVRRR